MAIRVWDKYIGVGAINIPAAELGRGLPMENLPPNVASYSPDNEC